MKSNCLTISIISLVIFIAILYLINQNQNYVKCIENYADLYDSTMDYSEKPLKTIILNARNDKNKMQSMQFNF